MQSIKKSPTVIMVADANSFFCELLTNAFKRRKEFRVVSCATTVEDGLLTLEQGRVDVAVVGAHLRNGPLSGLELVQQLRTKRHKARSVVLLGQAEQDLVVEAFRAGAKGLFSRTEYDLTALCKCVASVHAGGIWATASQFQLVLDRLSEAVPLRVVDWSGKTLLSKREEEVVRLVANGLGNRGIATELGLSEHTVKNHLSNIYEKLGVSSRVEVVLYAMSDAKANRDESLLAPTG